MAQHLRGMIKIDENAGEHINIKMQLKKAADPPKRAALGELGNRVLSKLVDKQKENLKDAKQTVGLKNIKPRVDTRWDKATAVRRAAVTRSDSSRLSTGQGPNKVSVVAKVLPTATKATTITLKQVKNEGRVSNPKVPQAKVEDKQHLAIRREDSNLSRRSLSKLRAALGREKKEKPETEAKPASVAATTTSVEPSLPAKTTEAVIEDGVESHSAKLLDEVENIDSKDSANLMLISEYVQDIYCYLHHLEAIFPVQENHLKKQAEVTSKMRAVLIDWINEVHYQFHLVPETFHMAVALIDRYLQVVQTTKRQHLQLVGVTALFIAAKYEELYPPEICDFVYITDNTYTKAQILEMEKKIMKTLDFQLGRPLPIHFLRRFSKAAKAIDYHHLLSKYFIELVSVDYSFASYKPSEVAAASLFLSLKLMCKDPLTSDEELWNPTLQYYSTYSVEILKPLVKKIANLVKNAPNVNLKAIYNKYQSSKFEKISTRSELYGPVIEKICEE